MPYENSGFNAEIEEKRKDIIHCLWNNQLYHLGKDLLNKGSIEYENRSTNECSCLLCLYRRMDFVKLLDKLKDSELPRKAEDISRMAFLNYIIGNHKEAAQTLKTLETKEDISNILRFLIKYNQKTTGRMLDFYDEQTTEVKQIAEPLLEIDLLQQHDLLMNTSNKEVLDWLHNSKFYNETLREVRHCTTEIRDLYNSKSSGTHENTLELLEWFLGLSDFIHQNGIFFNLGSYSDALSSTFIEGIFASLKCAPKMGGKLQGFTNRIAECIILNVHPEIIYKYSNRYKIKTVQPFEPLTKFNDTWKRIFDQFPSVQAYCIKNDANKIFRERYERIIYTTMAIFSIIETTKEETEQFCRRAIELFRNQQIFHHYKAISALLFLINKKKNILSKQIIEAFIDLWIFSPQMRSSRLLNLLSDILEEQKETTSFSYNQFEIIKEYCFSGGSQYSEEEGWDSLCDIYRIIPPCEHKDEIRNYANSILNRNFKGTNYYKAIIYDVIEPSEKLNQQYLQCIEEIVSKEKRFQGWWNDLYFHEIRVDQFFNYYFKYGFDLSDHLLKLLKEFDPYYEWLLDMEKFDYDKFNPLWLLNHFSYFYKQQYRKSSKLKEYLQQYIKENYEDADAQRVFMFTYGYDE